MDCTYKKWAGGRGVGEVVKAGGQPEVGYALQKDCLEDL